MTGLRTAWSEDCLLGAHGFVMPAVFRLPSEARQDSWVPAKSALRSSTQMTMPIAYMLPGLPPDLDITLNTHIGHRANLIPEPGRCYRRYSAKVWRKIK